MSYRPATHQDCHRLGEIHVAAWQAAYEDQFPAAYLDGLDPSELYAMNVDPPHWRAGIGSELLQATSIQLVEMALPDSILRRLDYPRRIASSGATP